MLGGIIYGAYKLGTKVIVPGAKTLGANVAGFFAKRGKNKDDVVDADYTELDDEEDTDN